MLVDFFFTLREHRLPVSLNEYLVLLEALEQGLAGPKAAQPTTMEDFYHLSRTVLVKDEKHFDRFDRAFSSYFHGRDLSGSLSAEIPEQWLRQLLQRQLSEEQKAAIEAMDWDDLMQALKKRLEEQKERHEGGNHWIGTGGTSPFGHGGYNPAGIRIGGKGGGRHAVKVWEERAYRDYDDTLALDTRNIKVALRRLRRFARTGSDLELDLPATIHSTASNAGWLDIRMAPRRHNNVKLLLLMDVGGSMDEHTRVMEQLFSAVRSEFSQLEFYYFHNCVYDFLWKSNRRRFTERFDTWDVIRRYNRDYRLILLGDASMSPYEIVQPGGSVEYHNAETGAQWLERLTGAFPHHAWINPEPQSQWGYRHSVALIRQLVGERMFPTTLQGLQDAMRLLTR